MKYTSHLLLVLALALAGCWPRSPTEPSRIQPDRSVDVYVIKQFDGREISPADAAVQRSVNLVGRRFHSAILRSELDAPYDVGRVWSVRKSNKPDRFLLLECFQGLPRLATTLIRLTLLDSEGATLAEAEFTTGQGVRFEAASLSVVDGIEFPVVAIGLQPEGVVTKYHRMWCAVSGDGFDLIRLEAEAGKATRNAIQPDRWEAGPGVTKQPDQDWEDDLCSGDRRRVLRALVWLSASNNPLAPRIRARPVVARKLRELASGEAEWEREMAQLAETPF